MEDYEDRDSTIGTGYHRRSRAMEAEQGPTSTVLRNPMVVIPALSFLLVAVDALDLLRHDDGFS